MFQRIQKERSNYKVSDKNHVRSQPNKKCHVRLEYTKKKETMREEKKKKNEELAQRTNEFDCFVRITQVYAVKRANTRQ